MRFLLLPLLCVFAVTASCNYTPDTAGAQQVDRIESGDTTIVRHLGLAGVWETPMEFVETGAIGALDGAEEEMFGNISDIAVDDAGGIYAFDGQAPALRYYDAEGNYVRTLGGKGGGPGEYQDASLGIVIRSDGRIVMRDPRNGRLNIYNPDGSYSDSWPVNSGLFTRNSTLIDNKDHLYLRIMSGPVEPNKAWPIALLHLDENAAVVDTIMPPTIANEPTNAAWNFQPVKLWTFSPLGYMVAGVNTTYAFSLYFPDGKMMEIQGPRSEVDVHPEERAEIEKVNDWRREYRGRHISGEIPPVPSKKPPYKNLKVDDDGRIWVHLYQPAVKKEDIDPVQVDERNAPATSWYEPSVYDVFQPDGVYLGEVHVPNGYSIRVIRGNKAWGTKRGEMGEPYIVSLTLQPRAL